jgi:hypothetical protein
LCSPWNARTPGVDNVGPLKIQGLPVTCSARDRPRAVCCVAEGLCNRPDFRSFEGDEQMLQLFEVHYGPPSPIAVHERRPLLRLVTELDLIAHLCYFIKSKVSL